MTKKKIMVGVLTAVMSASMVFSAFAMEQRTVDTKYYHRLCGGRISFSSMTYVKDGVTDGWYTEDGMWFYMKDGVASNKARKLNGVMNYFRSDGSWIDTSTQEYQDYSNLISKMREVKSNKDSSWSFVTGRTIENHKYAFKLIDDYLETYLYPTDNLEETCFIFKGATLSLDASSKYYDTEDKIRQVLNKLNVPEDASDEQKVRLIKSKGSYKIVAHCL